MLALLTLTVLRVQLAAHRSRLAGADTTSVDLDDIPNAAEGGRQEQLVSGIQIVAGHLGLCDGKPGVPGEGDDGLTRDAVQGTRGGRRRDAAARHREQVLAATLRYEPVDVEEDAGVRTGVELLELPQHVVEIVIALDPRVEALGRIAAGRQDHCPVAPRFLGRSVLGHDHDGRRAEFGHALQAEGPRSATDEWPDVAVA
jgi:hypothetical protein